MGNRTTNIYVDTEDYFAADLDNGGIRVGLYSTMSFDIPKGHELYYAAAECGTSKEVEKIFDLMMEKQP